MGQQVAQPLDSYMMTKNQISLLFSADSEKKASEGFAK
jgi:hypothetical protein